MKTTNIWELVQRAAFGIGLTILIVGAIEGLIAYSEALANAVGAFWVAYVPYIVAGAAFIIISGVTTYLANPASKQTMQTPS